ncbi:hypothetical protein AOL_s00211g3 [Orbilia oligospora ATCC 24927]|uniref:Uncharacterized protein n=1 Tax=Arthrobotrys oligospora (strain ATCC 24927 / CBS 115.81 / DSM 1491) TaxID=756982 RepID=G1XSN8_ARTOA|nr:hypothetical protein AOL_s00211g3 [Orbilia oligospora ATCC 24927]EGX43836.1 hypothetical protein AOL_s00211g3 [Orbilia oligospora ATCC 24927]
MNIDPNNNREGNSTNPKPENPPPKTLEELQMQLEFLQKKYDQDIEETTTKISIMDSERVKIEKERNKLQKQLNSIKPPRISDPTKFNGTPGKLDHFLQQLDTHFQLQTERFPDDKTKILFAGMYLEGTILQTYITYQQHCSKPIEEQEEHVVKVMTNYDAFTKFLKQQCKEDDKDDSNLYYRAREKLKTKLQQYVYIQEKERKDKNLPDMTRIEMQQHTIEIDDINFKTRTNQSSYNNKKKNNNNSNNFGGKKNKKDNNGQ